MSYTPGPWWHNRQENRYGAVVANVPPGCEGHDISGYGGYLIAESISGQPNMDLISACPELLEASEEMLRRTAGMFEGTMPMWRQKMINAVMKARGMR